MSKAVVKLKHIIDLIDYNRESEISKIQICHFDSSWDEFDEVLTSSFILVPLYEAEIKEMAAVDEDVIRVDIDWEKLNVFGWDKDMEVEP